MHEDEGLVGGFGDFAGVVGFLERVDLGVGGGLIEGCEFGEAFLAFLGGAFGSALLFLFPFSFVCWGWGWGLMEATGIVRGISRPPHLLARRARRGLYLLICCHGLCVLPLPAPLG